MKTSATFKNKTLWIGMVMLSLVAFSYYSAFFSPAAALALALLLTLEVLGMLYVGYEKMEMGPQFPWRVFLSWTFGFGLFRWLMVYLVLQYGLPDYTVFHYPDRAVIFLFLTSAVVIFLGYSFSTYQKGIRAQRMLAMRKLEVQEKKSGIQIKSSGKTISLDKEELLYLRARGEYVQYHTTDKNHLAYQRMKVAEQELKPHGFLRIHRSYLVNLAHVKAYTPSSLTLYEGTELPISKSYRSKFMDQMGY